MKKHISYTTTFLVFFVLHAILFIFDTRNDTLLRLTPLCFFYYICRIIFTSYSFIPQPNVNVATVFCRLFLLYDNAVIESFHAILKKEEVYRKVSRNFDEAQKSLFKYIVGWYNNQRIHGSIGYMTSNRFEALAI